MQTLIATASGWTLVPPSGLSITVKNLQLSTLSTSGNIFISGSASSYINTLYSAGSINIPIELRFVQAENVTVIPSSGDLIVSYLYAGEPEAYLYARAVSEYSALSGVAPLWNSVVLSGSYNYGSGKFGG